MTHENDSYMQLERKGSQVSIPNNLGTYLGMIWMRLKGAKDKDTTKTKTGANLKGDVQSAPSRVRTPSALAHEPKPKLPSFVPLLFHCYY